MNFKENVLLALAGLKANKMRAFLTMLGIIIGISSVIMITTMGSIVEKGLTGVISDLGVSNLVELYLTYKEDGAERGITESDFISKDMVENIQQHFGDKIKYTVLTQNCGSGTITFNREKLSFSLVGYTKDFAASMNTEIVKGRYITQKDIDGEKNICVIPSDMAEKIYGSAKKAVGQVTSLTIGQTTTDFTVVGVYKYKQTAFGGVYSSNYQIHIPISVALRISGEDELYSVVDFTSSDDVNVIDFSAELTDYINEKYYKNNDTFEVIAYTMKEQLDTINSYMGIVQIVLSVIAGISLLVGGIGVMNIMLVSVTERTREIGVRKALGAPNSAIRIQFIVESVIICAIGGAIGIISGILLGNIAGLLLKQTAVPSIPAILIAVTFSMAIGVFFGYYPANKAAKLDPIEALRYE